MIVKRRDDLVVDDAFLVAGEAGEQGERGINGVNGRDGVNGKPGVDGVDGQGFRWRGSWNRGTYQAYDTIEHEGSTYVAVAETNKEPPHSNWGLMASKGDTGETGEQGPRGPRSLPAESSDTATAIFDDATDAGMALCVSDSGVAKALATSVDGSKVVGLTVKRTVGKGQYRTSGILELKDWSEATGSVHLVPKAIYVLSPTTPGMLTTVVPSASGEFVTIVGEAISETMMLINTHRAHRIG